MVESAKEVTDQETGHLTFATMTTSWLVKLQGLAKTMDSGLERHQHVNFEVYQVIDNFAKMNTIYVTMLYSSLSGSAQSIKWSSKSGRQQTRRQGILLLQP